MADALPQSLRRGLYRAGNALALRVIARTPKIITRRACCHYRRAFQQIRNGNQGQKSNRVNPGNILLNQVHFFFLVKYQPATTSHSQDQLLEDVSGSGETVVSAKVVRSVSKGVIGPATMVRAVRGSEVVNAGLI